MLSITRLVGTLTKERLLRRRLVVRGEGHGGDEEIRKEGDKKRPNGARARRRGRCDARFRGNGVRLTRWDALKEVGEGREAGGGFVPSCKRSKQIDKAIADFEYMELVERDWSRSRDGR